MNPKLTIAIIILVILGGAAVLALNGMGVSRDEHHDDDDDKVESYEIYPGDLVEKIASKKDIILLDVRTPEEYEEVHLENALLLPVQQLSQQSLSTIGLGEDAKDKEIYLYCRSGARSKTAYDIMSSLGYTNIKSVAGGMIHWEEDEYPFTETGAYDGEVAEIEDTATSGGAKIAVDRKTHDFGTITQFGGVVETTFTVSNDGDSTLEIGQITTSCSCTSAYVSSRFIKVGGSAKLTVVFDPDFHEEPLDKFKRTVFIPSNDPSTPETEVSVTVDIVEGK